MVVVVVLVEMVEVRRVLLDGLRLSVGVGVLVVCLGTEGFNGSGLLASRERMSPQAHGEAMLGLLMPWAA